ncbi:hypothetical protein [Abyssalbus ytuae]|uniref:Uncharacterized protein n=1 Tax=Abyssalbus ytuae TaxID=2926907 RepID=A0A9E6ZLM7_9FLAO|nr:hypothetical protein [Abyssalbus ytuae]UOB16894.1 hypothetical protein MQE35_14275 [Abyssalbus ytuae]
MASIRDLKKDINNAFGEIIEAVYVWELASGKKNSKEGNAIIDDAISAFDELITKINNRKVKDRSKHLISVNKEFEEKATALIERLNKLD